MAGPASAAAAKTAVSSTKVYAVVFETGDIAGAGTDDYVWIRLNSTLGSSSLLGYLDSPADDFERNTTSWFYFTLPDLGELTSVDVTYQAFGKGSDWFLNGLIVQRIEADGPYQSCYPNNSCLIGNGSVHLNRA